MTEGTVRKISVDYSLHDAALPYHPRRYLKTPEWDTGRCLRRLRGVAWAWYPPVAVIAAVIYNLTGVYADHVPLDGRVEIWRVKVIKNTLDAAQGRDRSNQWMTFDSVVIENLTKTIVSSVGL